ncbi:hypothetical protein GCK72_007583 [Caenorhabditis remanei]|uniref:Uncharacterized protein n=1 Tax=Caenorhabditis remanei TaxID=31234 RepID=A0A6A5HLY4_CAERE|nr:hypothetical protein GCK72_007583 [Caenorhabditis remanei]KAF1767624.1 hypothetical protein GCK72_007583 [Caenorhabditis remanei]
MSQEHFLEFISNGNSNSHVGLLELLNPLQTHIGCAKRMGPAESYMLCVLGDEGQFKMWNLKKNSVKPGSSCKKGYKNESGLCTMPIPTTRIPPKKAPQTTDAAQSFLSGIIQLFITFIVFFL